MKTWLVFAGWHVFVLAGWIALGLNWARHPHPNDKFGNPWMFAAVPMAPCAAAGLVVGSIATGLLAGLTNLHPLLGGSLGYAGGLVVTLGLFAAFFVL